MLDQSKLEIDIFCHLSGILSCQCDGLRVRASLPFVELSLNKKAVQIGPK